MRKVIVSNYVTIDGFFAGPNGELDWFVWDDEMAKFSTDQLKTMDTILLGRVNAKAYGSGNVILEYEPVKDKPSTSG
jgi:hypothetical protein